ncbi:saccharopine dehydrogenase [Eremomyces bilateralis CBS 781.70]|uniref:Saccharopine dehydrogenase [NAD(+), L-lysine-forming] n=1 Tax=Eremomyces bilateralis CBS 781.70 TaxID=1392243 RepID=A0A6G1G9L8_9PEZI|nr:saccharopine dehydrogenase [Eremomyces bilateralis CBS 781.70]KAF1814777.1 saccharopine dehydrogenase [Eremomyces bilateralis CBS 781.70]
MSTTLVLRGEDKPMEHRSALTPTTAKALIDSGYTIKVERSDQRIFDDNEFSSIGAQLVEKSYWLTAPTDEIIIGLKELPDLPARLPHTHIQFAHVFKNQHAWAPTLARYARADGTLLDLEFLATGGRRVAAFGYHAGFAGAALAIKAWRAQQDGGVLKNVDEYTGGKGYYPTEGELVSQVTEDIKAVGRAPRVLVIGALGRCGSGAVELCRAVGVPEEQIVKWDMAETAKGGPFDEIAEADIFVNCIYLTEKIAPFITPEKLSSPNRNVTVICDVSADNTNPNNPVPVYTETSTFTQPTIAVDGVAGTPVRVISIDHLPSLLPREASEAFSGALLPYLKELRDWRANQVWADAERLYREKVATLPEGLVEKA